MAEGKRTATVQFDEDDVRTMEAVKKETGLSFSAQINLAMRGYEVVQQQAAIERRPPAKAKRSSRGKSNSVPA